MKLPSFAKINWSLRILGKRPDNYHEIVTLLQTVSLRDEISFEARDDTQITLTCDDPTIPTDDSNLIVKAALVLRDRLQRPVGIDVHLTKRMPAKGGLGGGSSNAAVTLMALNSLWQARLDQNELLELGSQLGSDVPFFFVGGCVLGEGTGSRLSPRPDLLKVPLIIVTPNASVSTSTAYRSLNAASLTTFDSASILSSSFAEPGSSDSTQWPLHNDFEGVIFEIEPEIKRAKMALLESGARGALLAGSGSSVFGTFESQAARERSLEKLKCEAGWRVFPCDTLSRDEYFQVMGSFGFPLFTLS